MPLRDHFRPPLDDITSWEGCYAGWPMEIVRSLLQLLPKPDFVAEPRVHHGTWVEVDAGAFERNANGRAWSSVDEGGVATATWAHPKPSRIVATVLPEIDEFDVLVFDTHRPRKFVSAIDIVCPANKDRPEHRRAFVSKCAGILLQNVSVTIIDFVTTRRQNLYGELLEFIGQDLVSPESKADLYAVACRYRSDGVTWKFETYEETLTIGKRFPPYRSGFPTHSRFH